MALTCLIDVSVDANLINKVANKHQLSREQLNAINYIASNGELKNIVGFAGTGKSKLLGAAREIWEATNYRVLGATLSGIAAENLANSTGIESRTLASRLMAWEKTSDAISQYVALHWQLIQDFSHLSSTEHTCFINRQNNFGS